MSKMKFKRKSFAQNKKGAKHVGRPKQAKLLKDPWSVVPSSVKARRTKQDRLTYDAAFRIANRKKFLMDNELRYYKGQQQVGPVDTWFKHGMYSPSFRLRSLAGDRAFLLPGLPIAPRGKEVARYLEETVEAKQAVLFDTGSSVERKDFRLPLEQRLGMFENEEVIKDHHDKWCSYLRLHLAGGKASSTVARMYVELRKRFPSFEGSTLLSYAVHVLNTELGLRASKTRAKRPVIVVVPVEKRDKRALKWMFDAVQKSKGDSPLHIKMADVVASTCEGEGEAYSAYEAHEKAIHRSRGFK